MLPLHRLSGSWLELVSKSIAQLLLLQFGLLLRIHLFLFLGKLHVDHLLRILDLLLLLGEVCLCLRLVGFFLLQLLSHEFTDAHVRQ